ncbi:hypothetical protein H4R34_006286, partial [Dimargaris verticillata]
EPSMTTLGKLLTTTSLTIDHAGAAPLPAAAKIHSQLGRYSMLPLADQAIPDASARQPPLLLILPLPSATPFPAEAISVSPWSNITLYSFWDHIQAALEVAEYESSMAVRLECTTNFLQIPQCLERLHFFGNIMYLDSFLHTFTILPA